MTVFLIQRFYRNADQRTTVLRVQKFPEIAALQFSLLTIKKLSTILVIVDT